MQACSIVQYARGGGLLPGAATLASLLQVWRWREGSIAMQLFQKVFSRDAWPSIQFTHDESRAAHAVNNAVNIYDPANFAAGSHVACALWGEMFCHPVGDIFCHPAWWGRAQAWWASWR